MTTLIQSRRMSRGQVCGLAVKYALLCRRPGMRHGCRVIECRCADGNAAAADGAVRTLVVKFSATRSTPIRAFMSCITARQSRDKVARKPRAARGQRAVRACANKRGACSGQINNPHLAALLPPRRRALSERSAASRSERTVRCTTVNRICELVALAAACSRPQPAGRRSSDRCLHGDR